MICLAFVLGFWSGRFCVHSNFWSREVCFRGYIVSLVGYLEIASLRNVHFNIPCFYLSSRIPDELFSCPIISMKRLLQRDLIILVSEQGKWTIVVRSKLLLNLCDGIPWLVNWLQLNGNMSYEAYRARLRIYLIVNRKYLFNMLLIRTLLFSFFVVHI